MGINHSVAAFVARNWRGELVFVCSTNVETILPHQAEVEVMRWAISVICYQALYFSDSSEPWRIKTIVQDISRKVSRFQDLSFSWVSRVANAAAHCFVEWSLNCNFVAVGSVGIGWCPPCLEIALVKDSVPL